VLPRGVRLVVISTAPSSSSSPPADRLITMPMAGSPPPSHRQITLFDRSVLPVTVS
jgi:hypothetical protein